MKSHHIGAVVVFLGCIITSSLTGDTATAISIVCASVFVSGLLLLYPTIENISDRKGTGELVFSPSKGVTFSWEVRSNKAIRTVFPEKPSNTTNNESAVKLCNEGRAIVKAGSGNKEQNIKIALEKFRKAAELDTEYWEPRVNIAQILLLTGNIKAAFSEAEGIRLYFNNTPLAIAKSGLIMARVLEQSISSKDDIEHTKLIYKKIVIILKDNLIRCPGHLTSMISLGRALLLSGADEKRMKEYLLDALQFGEFKNEFKKSLDREKMLDKFLKQFGNIFDDDEEK